MRIYTKTGDDGTTGLFGGVRVSKADERVEAYGTVDELNACLGLVREALPPESTMDVLLARIQSELFTVGAELATTPGHAPKLGIALLDEDAVVALERAIDDAEVGLPPLRTFVLPGGSRAASLLHLGRTVARRAERALVRLAADCPPRPELVRYLNRLSDLLFTLARRANHDAGVADVPWAARTTASPP